MSKIKRLLATVKINAFKLYRNGQIPIGLYHLIDCLNENDVNLEKKCKYLIDITNEVMRVRYYYTNKTALVTELNKAIEKDYFKYCDGLD